MTPAAAGAGRHTGTKGRLTADSEAHSVPSSPATPAQQQQSRPPLGAGGSGPSPFQQSGEVTRPPRLRLGDIARRALRWRRGTRRPAEGVLTNWQRIAPPLLRYGSVSTGNTVHVFNDGDEVFEQLWTDIDSAQRSVSLEVYTFINDRVGRRTLQALTAAARRGCHTLLIVDAVGSLTLTDAAVQPFIDAGGRYHVFNPLATWSGLRTLFRRDHRKIAVIDDRIGWCGGMNVSEEYAGPRHGVHRFRDCMLRLEGPAAVDLLDVTASTLALMKGAAPIRPRPIARDEDRDGTVVQVLSSAGRPGRRAIQRALRHSVTHAIDRCFITTPYFVPPIRLRRTITRAAARGVDVRILTAGLSDVPIVHLASQHVYGHLLRRGVRIYELHEDVIHAKTVTVDGVYATVGSFNLDHYSDQRNLEINSAALSEQLAGRLEDHFWSYLERSREITLEHWQRRTLLQRVIHFCAYQALRI